MSKVLRMLLVAGALSLCGCKVDLYTKLEEQEATTMMAHLLEKGMPCEKTPTKEGWVLTLLDKTDMSAAVRLMSAEGFPKHQFKSTGDIFGQRGLISSPQEDRIRFIYGISQELAETITRIDGVLEARVHIVLPENDPLSDSLKPSSASVFVKYDPGSQAKQNVTQIKQLVLNGIEGLTIDKVSVITVQGQNASIAAPSFTTIMGVTMLKKSAQWYWLNLSGAFAPFLLLLLFTFRKHIPFLRGKGSKPAEGTAQVPVEQSESHSLAAL